MPDVKRRREMYSEATKAALLDAATTLFAERGYGGTSLELVASASQVTRGAVYHHFASKQALFEAVLEVQESRATEQIMSAASSLDPWGAAEQALNAFLRRCCDPTYGRLVWLEGPTALGWNRFRVCEEKYFLGLIEGFILQLVEGGYLKPTAIDSTVRFIFWIFGGAGLALAETPEPDKPRVCDEWAALILGTLESLRVR